MRRLLIVEDNQDIIELLQSRIGITNFDLAVDFNSANDFLQKNEYDLVVTDFYFPGGDGNDVAEIAESKGWEVWLHTGDKYNTEIQTNLYNKIFEKLDRTMLKELDPTV